MADGRPLPHIVFVHLNSEARPVGNPHVTVRGGKHAGVGHVVERVVARIVMDAEALLPDEAVVAGKATAKLDVQSAPKNRSASPRAAEVRPEPMAARLVALKDADEGAGVVAGCEGVGRDAVVEQVATDGERKPIAR